MDQAKELRELKDDSVRLKKLDVKPLVIEPGSPWENGYVQSFNGKTRGELLNRELFDTLAEAQVLVENWRQEYNTIRPHSALGYRPPAPEATTPPLVGDEPCGGARLLAIGLGLPL